MVRKNIVVIRVVTLEDQTLLRMHGDLIEAYYPALRTDSYCIGEQPRGVCDLKTKTLAVPKIIALAKKHQDADAIVISCCDDPAVEELREMLSVRWPAAWANGWELLELQNMCLSPIGEFWEMI